MENILLAKALVIIGMVDTQGAARRLIECGGVEIDGVKINDGFYTIDVGREYEVKIAKTTKTFIINHAANTNPTVKLRPGT